MAIEDTLRKLVSIDSHFPKEKSIGVFIEKLLKENGFSTERNYVEKDRFNLLAEKGKSGKSILFYGHMDTVPMYGRWKGSAFKLRKNGDKLYGLGTFDMKGGCAAILESTKNVKNKHIKLLFGVDEENISKGAWAVVKTRKRWFKDVGVIIAAEAGVTDKNDGGLGFVTLGRRGRCVITIDVEGISSHGAEPNRGLSALDQAAKIAINVDKIQMKQHNKLGKESLFVREIKSSSTSLAVPDHASLDLDIHLVPPDTSSDAKKRVEAYIGNLVRSKVLNSRTMVKVYIKKRETPYLEPYITDEKGQYARKIMALIKKHAGKSVTLSYGMSVADENVFAHTLHLPTLTIGPKGGNEHSENEWVSHRSLEQEVALFKDIIDKV